MNNKCMKCNEVFEKKTQTQRFCSSKCRVSYYNHKKKSTKSCARCGENFIPTPERYKYCSEKCKKEKVCKNCGEKFYPDNHKIACCSEACSKMSMKRTLSEEDVSERFNKRFRGFKYHSGYTTIDDAFNIVCLKCGHIFQRTAHCIRPSKVNAKIECSECADIERQEKLAIEELNRRKRELEQARKRLIRTLHSISKQKRSLITESRECAKCGRVFEVQIDKKKRCCSKRCQTTLGWSENKIKRRRILFENGPVDKDITLERLAIRDGMVCHICGTKVDMSAHFNSDEYGSIDHIKPIAKGGTHTWSNVALAHRGCNTKKRDLLMYYTNEGQMRLSL